MLRNMIPPRLALVSQGWPMESLLDLSLLINHLHNPSKICNNVKYVSITNQYNMSVIDSSILDVDVILN